MEILRRRFACLSASLTFQLVVLLALQLMFFHTLYWYVPLRPDEYAKPILVTRLLSFDGVLLVAPFLALFYAGLYFRRIREALPGSAGFSQVIAALSCVTVVAVLFAVGPLPYPLFLEPTMVRGVLEDDAATLLLLGCLLLLAPAVRATRWTDIDEAAHTRWLALIAAGMLTWAFVTYDVNLYFGHAYLLERLLLLACCAAIAWHPIAIAPFLVLLMMVAAQGHFPLPEGRWMWPDKLLPLGALVVLLAHVMVVALFGKRTRPEILLVALLCYVGANYGWAGLNKMARGPDVTTWLLHNDLSNLFVSSYVSGGWLGHWTPEEVIATRDTLHTFALPLGIVGLGTELCAFLLLMHRKLTRVALIAIVVLHIGIFLVSGIFFWKWIVFDLALVAYLHLRRDVPIYTKRLRMLGLVVMLGAPLYFFDAGFAWFDTKLVNYFEIYGVAESGNRYRIHPRFFAPYDMIYQQSRHFYALREPVLTGTYGTSIDWQLTEALQTATPDDLPEIRRRFGRDLYSANTEGTFLYMVRRYVESAQRQGYRKSWTSAIAPPFHFQTMMPDDVYDFQEPLTHVEIRFLEALATQDTIVETQDELVHRIELEPLE